MTVVSAFLVSGSPLPMLRPDNSAWAPLAQGYALAAKALAASKPDVILLYSTQWIAVLDQLWQTRPHSLGTHVDENWYEFGDLPVDIHVDVPLAKACIEGCASIGVSAKPVDYQDFPIDTGTIVADTMLNIPRVPLAIAANNVYHDFASTERMAAMAAAVAAGQGKRVAVVGVGGLSGAYFDRSIDIATDHVRHPADDAANRAFLDALCAGSDAARAAVGTFASATKADMGMKHLAWVLGGTGGFSGAKVHGYGATYGAGAAVVEFVLA
jgi:2-aminophenol/2-amino-5-chlorophenol 1,6-dioxygenase alpha subunit